MKNIGYLGLGAMGQGMARNLVKKTDSDTVVWGFDPVPAARESFASAGGKVVTDAKELYRSCDVIFFSLPTNDLVRSTMQEILQTAKRGTTIVDMGSTSPYIIRELHEQARAAGFSLLDSPVSGGKEGADNATLVIMCGGEKEVYDSVLPYLEMMGKNVTYMGGSGCGSMSKVANNMLVGIHLSAIGETYAFAKKAGLDPRTLFEAIHTGFAASAVQDAKVPMVLERDFVPTARIAVHYKDIHNAMEMAEKLDVELPMTHIVEQQMDWINDNGLINEDQSAMAKFYEAQMGVVIE
jgi:2-hydroxy-3-oxopropionate reductase